MDTKILSMKRFVCFLMVLMGVTSAMQLNAQSDSKPINKEKIMEDLNRASSGISFMENKGQWPSHVIYRADIPGGQMLATPQGMLIGKFDPESQKEQAAYFEREEEYATGKITKDQLGEAKGLRGHGWRFNFVNGNLATPKTIERKGESSDYYNFLIGDASTHATNVHSYNELMYKDVYSGVDVRYYTSAEGDFENDIIVAPGADYSKILLQIEGVERIRLDDKGDLVFGTTVGEQTIPALISYLVDKDGKRTPISVKYKIADRNTVSFDVPKYDLSKTLVIDPIVIRWATFISGNSSSDAHFHGIDVDASGNIFTTGRYNGNLITVGAFQTSNNGTDLFISKYTEPATPGGSGVRVWQTYLGNSGTDNPYALTLGLDGYLYIVGSAGSGMSKTYGTGFSSGSWTQRTGNGQTFIAKVSPNGTGAAVRTLGTSSSNWGVLFYDVRVLPTSGNGFDLVAVGVVNEGSSSVNGDIPQATQPNGTSVTNTGHNNGYAVRITNDLSTLVWAKQYSSSGGNSDQFNICAIDNQKNIIVGGYTRGSSGISYSNPSGQNSLTGNQDGWLMRLNASNGNALWSRYFNAGSGNSANILCMETNSAKDHFIIGGLASGSLANSNITSGAYQTTYQGSTDFFVASLPIGGASTTWGTYFGGSDYESNMMGLNLDQNDDVYVLGYSDSKDIPTYGNPVQKNNYDNNDRDAVFFKLSSNGSSLQYSTYIGGDNDETDPVGQRGIKFSDCRIYLPITTYSTDFPLTQGTLTSTKSSSSSIGEPALISMANPPDLQGNNITGGATQTITCGSSPAPITASVPSYIFAKIIRDNSVKNAGTTSAYPDGLPVINSYQWQASIDSGASWTNISGATSQNYTPPNIYVNGVTKYRRIINGDACNRASDTLATVTIIVTPSVATPTVSSNSPLCAGQTLNLTSHSTTSGVTYAWTGPNSFTSSLQNPSINNVPLAASGTYYVVATSGNGCKSNPGSTSVLVSTAPTVGSSSSSNPTTCGGTNGSITLNGLNSNTVYSVNYIKDGTPVGPIGISSNGSGKLVISNLGAGVYTGVTVALSGCSSNALSFTLTNPTGPSAPSNVNASPNPICTGNTLTLSATGSNLAWAGPSSFTANGSPVTRSITSTSQGGTYSVTQTVAGCTSPPATVSVAVNQTPSIASTNSSNPTTCSGSDGSITLNGLNNSASYSVSYSKNGNPVGPVNISSNGTGHIVITGLTAGSYTNITVTLSGCTSAPVLGPIVLIDPANPTSPTVSNSGPACYGDTMLLFASNVFGGTYTWSGPNSFTSNSQNPVIVSSTPAMSGNYSVYVTVNNCNSSPATTSVTVTSCPPVAVDDAYSTNEDQPLPITSPGVLVNDYDPANPQQPLTVTTTPICGPYNGSVLLSANGSFTYTPSLNYNGLDSFCYRVCDTEIPSACDTAVVVITVTPVNDPPFVPDTLVTTPEDTPTTVCLPITDPESASQSHLVQSIYCGPNNGTISSANINNGVLPHDLCLTYTPDNNFNGTDSICIVVCDNGLPQLCDTTHITIVVTPVNDPPIAVDDYFVSCLDTAIAKNALANDIDIDGPSLAVTSTVCGPYTGSLSIQPNGNFIYTPTPFFNSKDSFCYVICDFGTPNLCDTGVVVLDYTCTNTPPVAVDDHYTTNEDQTLNNNVSTNDYDPNGDSITYNTTPLVDVNHGALTLNSDGSFTYVPTPNYFGGDTFVYVVCDNGTPSLCDTATAYIAVLPVNDPPFVPDTLVTTPEDTPTTVCIPITDIDLTDQHIAALNCNALNGTVSNILVNNISNPHEVCVSYTPDLNFNGTDSFCIVVCDNGLPSACDTSVVTIVVTPVNDPPVAVNDHYTTNEDTPLSVGVGTGVRANDNDDADGNPVSSLTINTTPITGPAHGTLSLAPTGSFIYTPDLNYNGVDSFLYIVCDNGTPLPSLCDTGTAYITVLPVNDPPFIPDTLVITPEDTPIVVCLPITDPETTSQIHIGFICDGPDNGSVSTPSVNNASNPHEVCMTYTPNTNYNGTDSFCVIVCDNGNPIACDTSIITIIVTPVNDPPIAVNDNYSTDEDIPLNVPPTGVLVNDSDPDGTALTASLVSGTTHGLVSLNPNGSFTYTPNSNYNGTDTFFYSACDAGIPMPSLCDTAMVVITVNPVNDPPMVPDTTVTIPEDSVITVCLPITDVESATQMHTVSLCDAPDNGLITFGPVVNNGSLPHTVCITYRPNSNFNGLDSICLTICDNGIPFGCDNSTIHIIVTPVNDPPVAVNDNYTIPEDSTLTVPAPGVLGNDNDPDGTPLTSTIVTGTSHGSVSLNPNGSFTYTPNNNYNGMDTFFYSACDAGIPMPSLCDTAMVVITVTPVNDIPEIPDTIIHTPEDTPTVVCLPIIDLDSLDIHTYTSCGNAFWGTVSMNVNNASDPHELCVTYTPYLNFNGTDSLCVIICDNGTPQGCDTSHITIIVDPRNDPPYADTIYVVTYENQPVGVNVASATGDVEGDPLSYSYGGVTPNNGTYGITGNGAIVVIPNTGFTGTFTIPYGVCDLSPYPVNVLCDSAAIVVTVLPGGDTLINHSPVASNDYVTTPMNTSIVVNELANDYDPDGDALQVTVTCPPQHGSYTMNPNGTVNYFPHSGFFGFDTICYTICDPTAAHNPKPLCDNAIIVISVSHDPGSNDNDPPVAVDDFAFICADANATLNLLLNDYDPNGDAIASVNVFDNVSNGILTNAGFGFYVYTPNSGFNGNDTLYYSICDNGTPSLCDTAMAVIFVSPTPVITPSASSLTICSADTVNITLHSNVPGTVIHWTATNGTSGTGDIYTILTNNTSVDQIVTYTVTAATPAGCGASAVTIPVTVKPRPTVSYTANGNIFCSGSQVIINMSSNIAGTTYTWSGTNGNSGNGSLITDSPVNAGASNITVTYSIIPSFGGCSGDTVKVSVTVKPNPVLSVNPITQTICSGTPITIAISSNIVGTSVNWTGSNGNSGNSLTINDSPINSSSSNITVTYTVNGSYNGCPANTITSTVVVRPVVIADAGNDKSTVTCSGACVNLGGSPTGSGGSGLLSYQWSPSTGLNDSSLANPTACGLLTSTTYTVIVTDTSGCFATDQVAITLTPNTLAAEAGSGGAVCLGSGDSVMLGGYPTAVGGSAPYTYTWAPVTGLNLTNSANPEAYPITTTKYFVTVTDQNGCSSVDSTTVTVYPVLNINAGTDTTVCAGQPFNLGGTPTASGGSGSGYTYLWSPTVGVSNVTVANPIATAFSTTTYAVTVFDGNGCSATDNVLVTVHETPVAMAGPDKNLSVCPKDSIVIGDNPSASGGTGPYTYSWSPLFGLSASTIPNPGVKGLSGTQTYSLVVTDANGCTSSDYVTVNVVPNTLQAYAGNNTQICSGTCVQIGGFPVVNGGFAPFTFNWSGGSLDDSTQSNPIACPSGTVNYNLVITDDKGCTATSSMTVIVNPKPAANAGTDTFVCVGSSVVIGGTPSATGGTAPYNYNWVPTIGLSLPNVSNPSASPVATTSYTLVVTDAKGCISSDTVTVTTRSLPNVNAGTDKTLTACAGDTTFIGGIPVVVSGGTGPFTYQWSPALGLSNSTIQNPLVTGISTTTSYQILVTDSYGCQGVDYAIVNVVPSTLQAEAGNSGVVCAAANTPVQLGGNPTATGGASPYTYHWGPSAGLSDTTTANPVATVSTSTTFYVTVTDSKGCTSIDSVTVTQHTAPVANAGTDSTFCAGFGKLLGGTPTASSGSGPYLYSWTPTLGLNNNNTPNPLAIPQVTTVYTVVVTDSNGCQASDAVTITIRPNPVSDAGVDKSITTCSGDSVQIGGSPAASGGTPGYTYAWGPSAGLTAANVANPYVKGIASTQPYALTVTDQNGCSAVDVVIVNVVTSTLTAEAGNGGVVCSGTGASVNLGGSPTATGGAGPYVYHWSPSGSLNDSTLANPIATPIVSTIYHVTVSDSKGCYSVDSTLVKVNLSPTANAGIDTAICAGSPVILGGSPTATGGKGPYTYSWSPGSGLNGTTGSNPTATPTANTTYTVTVTDYNGCTASASITVTVHQNPVANAGPDKTLVGCSGDSIQIGGSPSATGGSAPYVYDWAPNGGLTDTTVANPYVHNIGSTTTYTLAVVDQYGCSATDQVLVNVTNSSLVAEAGNNVAFCAGASVNVTLGGNPTAQGGTPTYNYTWSPNNSLNSSNVANPIASPLQSTTYTLVVTDAHGCISSDTVRITIHPRPTVSAGVNDTICSGTCVALGGSPTASGGSGSTYVYSWTPAFFFSTPTNVANPVVCPTNNITYQVTATDSLGCSNTANVSIKVNQNPIANAGADNSVVYCKNACVQIGGSPTATSGTAPYLYAWSPSISLNNTGLPNPTVCNLSVTGTYTVTVTDANGCTATDQVVINSTPSTLVADAGVDKSICAGQNNCITIGGNPSVTGGNGPFNITWSPVAGICNSNTISNPDVNPTDTTTYVIVVQDASGCIAFDSMTVIANPAVTASVGADTAICNGGVALMGGNPTGSGGTAPYSYSWSPGNGLSSVTSSNPTAQPTVITAYCVTVTDAVGCTASTCQRVGVNPAVTANAGPDQTITACVGSFATLGGSPVATGGSGNYSYQWSPDSVGGVQVLNGKTIPSPIVTNLSTTTTFTLTVTDNVSGCSGTDQVTITVNQSTLTADAGLDKTYCANSPTGVSIGGNPTAQGGQSPYIYQWATVTGLNNPNVANPVAVPVVTTTYIVTVTDNLGCSQIDSMTVHVGPQIAVNAGLDTLICYNTSVVLGANPVAVGGTGAYSYAWTPSQYLNSTTVAHPTAQNVTSNVTFTVTVTDSFGCSASDMVVIGTRALPTASAGPDVSIFACTGDSAVLGGSPTASGTVGPYTYQWSPALTNSLSSITASNPVVHNLGFNTNFIVTVTDSFGCKANDNVQVTVMPNTVFVEAGVNVGTLCANVGGCVTLGGSPAVSGGQPPYLFQWIGGIADSTSSNPLACPSATTTYTLIATDQHGCQASDTVQVIVNQPAEANIVGLSAQYCVNAGGVTMTGIPAGGTFTGPGVSGNVFQPSSVGIGNWCIKYTYTNPSTGCTDDTTVCVNVYQLPNVTITGNNASYCRYEAPDTLVGSPAGGTFTGAGMSGNIFNPGTANLGNNVITYTYTDSLSSGCTNSVQITINVKAAPTISISVNDDSACVNQPVTISPNYSPDVTNIQWLQLGGTTFASGLNPVTITPTGVDYCVVAMAINTNSGCVANDTICIHVNQNPVALNDSAQTCEDEPVIVPVLNNDSDPEGDANSVSVIGALHGTGTVQGSTVTYTPALNFNGEDTLTYVICNTQCSNECDTAKVFITVIPKNDVPVVTNLIDTIYQGTTDTVCPMIVDVDGDPISVTILPGQTINGTVSLDSNCIVFTPNPGWIGTQVITFEACDQVNPSICDGQIFSTCDTGTVTIEVLPANHAPIALKVNVTVCHNTSIGINTAASASDPDGDPLTFSYGTVSGPANSHSVLTVTGNGALVFSADSTGYYTFPYYVCDQSNLPVFSLCDTAMVIVRVVNCDSTNEPPVATDDAVVMNVNDTININELANDYDPDGDPLNVTILSGPGLPGATASLNPDNTITYTSPTVGVDTMTYVICDPYGACDTAIIIVFVDSTSHNHPPVAVDDFATTNYMTAVTVPVTGNDIDPDGDPFTVTAIPCLPSDGVATIVGNTVVYVPGPNANALNPDTFCYVICDNGTPSLCDTATVVVYINNSVVAVNDTTSTGPYHPITVNVLHNDYDPENDTFWVVTVITDNTTGTATQNSNGTITYTPATDTCGFVDQFSYVIQDINGAVDTATVFIRIDCCVRPTAVNDSALTLPGDQLAINPLSNDDGNGYPITGSIITGPFHGTAQFANDSLVIYTSDANYCGIDTIVYAIESHCGIDTALLLINVYCNIPPIAVTDTVEVCDNSTIKFNPLSNDVDSNGNQLIVTGIVPPFGVGGFSLNNNVVTFVSTSLTGTFVMNYFVCDNGFPSYCDTGTVFITIKPCALQVDTIYDTTFVNTPVGPCIGAFVNSSLPLTITSICDPDNGSVTYQTGDTCFTYTPDPNYFGNDVFCITLCDSFGNCNNATVIITVLDTLIQAVDEPCDLDTTVIHTPITIDVLANDIIPFGGDTTVTVMGSVDQAVVVVNDDNTITVTPNPDFIGFIQFSYEVCVTTGPISYCDTATVCVSVIDTNNYCFLPNGFSPNGDGVNDLYVVPCNEDYPQSELRVFDRWGVEIWKSNGHYLNDWDGTNMQGTKAPDATYYIIYDYNDGHTKRKMQFVVLHR